MAKRINSRAKGKRGELEFVNYLKNNWLDPDGKPFTARTGRQHRGGPDSPDVLVENFSNIHWEVTREQCITVWSQRLREKMVQAKRDAAEGQIPAVVYRRNREPWLIAGERPVFGSRGIENMLVAGCLDDWLLTKGCRRISPAAKPKKKR